MTKEAETKEEKKPESKGEEAPKRFGFGSDLNLEELDKLNGKKCCFFLDNGDFFFQGFENKNELLGFLVSGVFGTSEHQFYVSIARALQQEHARFAQQSKGIEALK